jgi:hypothetical protein
MKVNSQCIGLQTNAGRQTIKSNFGELRSAGQGNGRQLQRLAGFAEELDDAILFGRGFFDRPAGNDLLEELDHSLTWNRKRVTDFVPGESVKERDRLAAPDAEKRFDSMPIEDRKRFVGLDGA